MRNVLSQVSEFSVKITAKIYHKSRVRINSAMTWANICDIKKWEIDSKHNYEVIINSYQS